MHSLKKIHLLVANAFLFFVVLIYNLTLIEIIEGDPSIYLSFALNFFDKPFSFGPDQDVSFGATSPIFLIILSTVFQIFGLESFGVILKAINLLFLYGSAFVSIKIVDLLFQQEELKLNGEVNLAPKKLLTLLFFQSLLLLFFNTIDNTARLFETSLVLFFVSLLTYSFIQKHLIAFFILGSFSYLIRPEIALLFALYTFIFFLESIFYERKKIFGLILFSIISTLPTLIYHWYIFVNTSQILPSSVVSRATRNSEIDLFYSVAYLIYKFPFIIIIIVSSVFIFRWIFRQLAINKSYFNEYKRFLYSCIASISLLLFIILFSKSMSLRYAEFVLIPFFIILIVIFINSLQTLPVKRSLTALIVMSLSSFAYGILNPVYPEESTLEVRFDQEFSNKINKIMSKGERIAIYEIQTQFYLREKVISLDGRVGNHMSSFMLGNESLIEALSRNNINYISVDKNVSPFIRSDPFYQFLESSLNQLEENQTLKYNEEIEVELKIKKQHSPGLSMYGSIFRVSYLIN